MPAKSRGPAPLDVPTKPTPLDRAKANPFQFFSLEEVGEMFGFGGHVMSQIAAAGAPIVARKCNPQLLLAWLGANSDKIKKAAR